MFKRTRWRAAVGLTAMILGATGAGATAPVGAVEDDPAARLARAHGFDRWDEIEAIRFTFSVRTGDETTTRSWRWRPEENTVRLTALGAAEADGEGAGRRVIEYDRDALDAAPDRVIEADRKFINDTFWLLLPLHLAWAEDVAVRETGDHALPLGEGRAKRIVVAYPERGGYTPGDRYALYVDDDDRLVQWTYHRGGAEAPTLATTWAAPARVGPLLLHLKRRNAARGFEMTFIDVAVRLAGEPGWVEAEPLKAQADADAGDDDADGAEAAEGSGEGG